MEHKRLGTSDLMLSPLGFGTWAIGGGDWAHGWGDQDDRQSIAAIQHAVERGINWIDTAAAYGLGHAETVIGRALKGMAARPYVFTKCSLVWDERGQLHGNLQAASLRNEVEASLRRLQVEAIDLYQIHWPNPDEAIEEGWETLAALQAEGKLRYIGVSNFSIAQMERIRPIAPIVSLQPPYSLINRDVEDQLLPYCRQHNIGVIVYSPMHSGLLSGKMTKARALALPDNDWRSRDADFQEPLLSQHLGLVEHMRRIAQHHGCSVGELAIAWTLRNPAVTGAIVGFRSPAQVEELLGAASLAIDSAALQELDSLVEAGAVE